MDQAIETDSNVTTVSSASELPSGLGEENALGLPSVKEVYCCPYNSCNFSTAWKSSLNMHMKTHTDERPWQCALCNKHFKLKHHLKHHILTHSQHKLFKCNLCEYRCNDSHSLQRHKVNRHRFPIKRPVKRSTLPTMVALPSVEAFSSNSNNFLNTLLEHQQQSITSTGNDSSTCSLLPFTSNHSAVRSSSSLSSISQMIMQQQQNLQNTNNLKLRSIRSVSDSFSPPFVQRISSSENDSVIDLIEDVDKIVHKRLSVSPIDSGVAAVKEETSHDRESPNSLQKTPNSQTSFDYLHGNRSSVDLIASKSPTIDKQFSVESQEQNHSPVFEEHQKSELSDVVKSKAASRRTDASSSDSSKVSWKCVHCEIIFPDNLMYGLHMGCHSVGNPFQCNVCAMKCKNRHDFMFHFTIGKHLH